MIPETIWEPQSAQPDLIKHTSKRMITKSITWIVLLLGGSDKVVILTSTKNFVSTGKKRRRVIRLTVRSTKIDHETTTPHLHRIGNDTVNLRQDARFVIHRGGTGIVRHDHIREEAALGISGRQKAVAIRSPPGRST